jgi:ribosomal protein S18 acetylase RimI-like enzyme
MTMKSPVSRDKIFTTDQLDSHRIAAMAVLARHASGWVDDTSPGIRSVLTGAGTVTSNFISVRGRNASTIYVRALAELFAEEKVPWGLEVSDVDEEMRELAKSLNLRSEIVIPTMTVSLSDAVPEQRVEESTVERVRPDRAFLFAQVAAAGFDAPVEGLRPFANEAFFNRPEVAAAWAKDSSGQPVAVGMSLATSDSVVGLYVIATLPSCRKRGHASAVTRWLMEDARARGRTTAYLQASPEGQPVYERLGFATAQQLTYFVSENNSGAQ